MAQRTVELIAAGPIKSGGKRVEPDERFSVRAEHVGQLLASGSARRLDDADPVEPVDSAAGGGEGGDDEARAERVAAIRAAIENLRAEDPEQANDLLWRKDGTPRKPAVGARVPFELHDEELSLAIQSTSGDE